MQGCDRPVRAKGLCEAHYRRMKKGKPLDSPVRPMVSPGTSVTDKLALYVERRGDGECWPWTMGCDKDGYGEIATGGSSKHRRAHVVAWEQANGRSVPPGHCVLHTCDNPPCCNPGHLFLGTNLDNIWDKVAKNRQARGENHPKAKLTGEQVLCIRRAWQRGMTLTQLGIEYQTSTQNIYAIVNRKSWTHI